MVSDGEVDEKVEDRSEKRSKILLNVEDAAIKIGM